MHSPAVAAAIRFVKSRDARQKRLSLTRDCRGSAATVLESLRAYCIRVKVPFSSVQRHVRAIEKTGRPYASVNRPGRPGYLTDAEDDALTAWVAALDVAGLPPRKRTVIKAANQLRQLRTPPEAPVKDRFFSTWMNRHPELRFTGTKPVEASRRGFDCQLQEVKDWFKRSEDLAEEQQPVSSGVWNADEMGIRIGCRDGRIKVVSLSKKKNTRPEVTDPANRESLTLIGCGNAAGDSLPPFCILSAGPYFHWADSDLDERTAFVKSETGFSNSNIMMAFMRWFNQHSWASHADVVKQGSPSLEDWFGYGPTTEFKFLLETFDQNDMREGGVYESEGRPKIWRWLLLDGFAGHLGIEVIDYCQRFDIQLNILPSHSTHRMQPMDVGVFTHFKRAHQNVLFDAVERGEISFSRSDFMEALGVNCCPAITLIPVQSADRIDRDQPLWKQTFTRGHVLTGFEDSGIWPLNPAKIINDMEKNASLESTYRYPDLVPEMLDFSAARYAAQRLQKTYLPRLVLSSPTRDSFSSLVSVVHQAPLIHGRLQDELADRQSRLSKAYRKRRSKMAEPADRQFCTPILLADLRQKHTDNEATEAAKKQRKADVSIHKMRKVDREAHIQAWRDAGGRFNNEKISQAVWLIKAGFDEATFQSEGKRLYPRRPKRPSHLPDNELYIVDTQTDGALRYSTEFPSVEGYAGAAGPGEDTDEEVDFILKRQAAIMASSPPLLPSQAPDEVDQPSTPTKEQLLGLIPADCVDPDLPLAWRRWPALCTSHNNITLQ
ncbi:hypothetical protein RB594_005260 [Gaeumannomyces avenae]